ncbi:DUF2786 domain-containing protein [Nocardiopsis sp. MG754419]|uniref:DUF2786 domain-containing protein n=1 Tax=Nocardiopsis sp. MG754419 TaxID=2259865 RepID=UPI0027DD2A25|nr:DUF2786 domain-containing protein [Nocardiopsis sp. MG754419]MBR8743001.1 hypothetical protein [Nocardiopsis sp. MG754419]
MGRKGRRRDTDRTDREWAGPTPGDTPVEVVAKAVDALVRGQEGSGVDLASARLADVENPHWAGAAARALFDTLLFGVADAWARGWQPGETVRHVRREAGPLAAAVCADAVAADLERHSSATVDPRWADQVRALGVDVGSVTGERHLEHLAAAHDLMRFEAVEAVLRLLAVLRTLPPMRRLGPPPGTFRPGTRTTHTVDRGRLQRVRALLAKAESTEFPQEAEALTARAQEMMARHSIDLALVAADPEEPEAASARRLPVDSPYDEHRAVLLNEVAEANHCRAVWHRELGLSTVMGFPGDVEAVDLLYTSLLVQAETAMRVNGAARDRSGRGARKDYRASFLAAFAVRVGERLTESARATEEAVGAETGTDLVPVFAAREQAVEAAVDEAFGALTTSRVRGPADAEGWYEGRAAADAASLGARTHVTR